jgi:asparagine synthase (glutamine-hydrolysing)
VPAPHAIFEGVRKLRPGHILPLDRRGRLEERAFWRLLDVVGAHASARAARPNEPEAQAGLATVLAGAIRQHMIADVPLGVLLSGGIDSSLIVALARAQTSRPIETFTIGYDDPAFDEAPQARAVAEHLGTVHHDLHVGAKEAISAIEDLPWIYDEPFADSSQIPSVLVARFARRRVTVCLAGDGGDELFAGYERYHWAAAGRRLDWLPARARRLLAQGIRALPTCLSWVGRQADARLGDRIAKLARLLSEHGEAALYRSQHSHWPSPEELVTGGAEPDDLPWTDAWSLRASFIERQQLADLLISVPDDLLTKLDRASMAVGLEARVPLLDHRVIEYCCGLPDQLKYRSGMTKYLLRRVLYEHVPPALIERPKRGFRAPIAAWLRTSLRDWSEDLLAETRLRRDGLFDAALVRATWHAFLSGRGGLQEGLWGILMFQAWQPAFAARLAKIRAGAGAQPATPQRLAVS